MPEFSAAYTIYSWCSGKISVFGYGWRGRGGRRRKGRERERGRMERVDMHELDYLLHSNASWETCQPGLSLSDFFLKS